MKYLLSLLFLLAFISLNGETFYEQYGERQRMELATAYMDAGNRFVSLGQVERGNSYIDLAQEIYPEVLLQEQERPEDGKEGQTLSLPSDLISYVEEDEAEAAVKYFFGKLVRAVIKEDKGAVLEGITPLFFAPGYNDGITKEAMNENLDLLYELVDFSHTSPGDFYDFDTVEVTVNSEGGFWVLAVKSNEEAVFLEEILTFWDDLQVFTFVNRDNSWKLISITGADSDSAFFE